MYPHAWGSDAQALVFDLEDSVPPDHKAMARELVAALRPPDGWTRPVYVRLNSFGSPDFAADLRSVSGSPLAGVIVPKVERAAVVQAVDQVLPAAMGIIPLVETPGGVMRMGEIADSGIRRVIAFAFGAEDYRAGMGVGALNPALSDFARATVANGAAAARVPAIDAPELEVKDAARVRTATRHALGLGFQAKFAIHPAQVPVIHEVFASADDHAWATRVVLAYRQAAAEGKGSAVLDDRMIDEATMKRARDILAS